MAYSKWLKTDLHIHSHISKKTKVNDYDGCDLTYEKLVEALKRENINLFSITDHNTVNIPLYAELIKKREDLIENKLNFVIGAEIDFMDEEIHDEIFHMLVYFDTFDLAKVEKVITGMYGKTCLDEIDKNVPPISLWTFFKSVFDNGIRDIITIPHFNNKDKGIPPKDQIDRFVYTVFNALEDSNNRNNLIKSLNAFKNSDYTDVPIVIFSDNHNIDIYPYGKNGYNNKQTSMHILGNIKFPFNSIKSAFQDVNTRISIDNLDMRCTNNNRKYIKAIKIDGNILPLSEYQNTIIGGFGSGKSFLLDMILKGKDNVDRERYSELANKYESFSIVFSDDTTRESLSEVNEEVKIIKFDQYKDIYFKNILLDTDKSLLETNLHIDFPILNIIEEHDETEFKDCFNRLKENYENNFSVTDIINYDAISRRNEKSYSFKGKSLQQLYNTPEYLEHLKESLKSEIEKKVLDKDIYSEQEKQNISTSKDIIIAKNNEYKNLSDEMERILDILDEKISCVNKTVHQNNAKISSNIQIFEDIKEDIKIYINLLEDLKNKAYEFETRYSKEKYDELKKIRKEKDLYTYKLIAKYYADEERLDYNSAIIKSQFRKDSLFQSIIFTMNSNEKFIQNQTFNQRMDYFTNKYYSNFKTVCYDIYDNGISIMKKSAGEKANTIINIIFNIIEDYSSRGISSIVILDQPEDNLDNKGIKKEVVERIRSMKSNNCLPQLICVTHNANISITADSENIILASKADGKCTYKGSGIEDTDFINEVCRVVEGGKDALKKRGTKFNIPIIKELERGI
jgi:ABC-type lipoprotein export system ATPase subunit